MIIKSRSYTFERIKNISRYNSMAEKGRYIFLKFLWRYCLSNDPHIRTTARQLYHLLDK